jgi:hypothetical protein
VEMNRFQFAAGALHAARIGGINCHETVKAVDSDRVLSETKDGLL